MARASGVRYLCQYHLIWIPKFRFNVLKHRVDEELKKIFQEIADNYEFEIIAMEIMPDHVHLFVGAKPDISPSDIVRTFKSISAIEVFKRFPKLRGFYSKAKVLWSRGKFISTIGVVSAETVKKYIAEQKDDSEGQGVCMFGMWSSDGQRFERCCKYKEYRTEDTEGHSGIYACGDWRLQNF